MYPLLVQREKKEERRKKEKIDIYKKKSRIVFDPIMKYTMVFNYTIV